MSTTPGTKEYNTLHHQIRRERGPAKAHDCVDCGGQARDWSHRHDTKQLDVFNYDPRCRRCHEAYDDKWTQHQHGEAGNNAKLTDALVVEVRDRYGAGGVTQRELALLYGVNQQAISKIVRGQRWAHVR